MATATTVAVEQTQRTISMWQYQGPIAYNNCLQQQLRVREARMGHNDEDVQQCVFMAWHMFYTLNPPLPGETILKGIYRP